MKVNDVARISVRQNPTKNIESIDLQQISVTCNHDAVNNISLKLQAGKVYGFLGNAEKRKLLFDLIYGITQPEKGSIIINNTTDLTTMANWSSHIKLLKNENALLSTAIRRTASDTIAKTAAVETTVKMLLQAAPVLLFDKAMTALGITLEERVLRQLCLKNESNIIILNTDHPGSLKYCDHIFLIRNSRVKEVSKRLYFSDLNGIFSGFSGNYL